MTQRKPTTPPVSSEEPRGSWGSASDEDLTRDAVGFGVGPHDLRVQHGEWVHYVKVVPVRRNFLRTAGGKSRNGGIDLSPSGASDVFALAIWAVIALGALLWGAVSWLRSGRPDEATQAAQIEEAERVAREKSRHELDAAGKQVGVVRIPSSGSWRTDRPAVVEKYELSPGEAFTPHLEALAARAASGEFDPTA